MRAKAEIETSSTHDKIVVTEIPYGVNKAPAIYNSNMHFLKTGFDTIETYFFSDIIFSVEGWDIF